MMHFDLCVNGKPITKFSVGNIGPDDTFPEMCRYDWTSYRPNPETGEMDQFTNSEVIHNQDDGIEELAYNVLSDWRRLRRMT
jgi:hypothetical protein